MNKSRIIIVTSTDSINLHTIHTASNSTVCHCFEMALKWMEQQPECNHLQLLAVKRLQELATQNDFLHQNS